MNKQLTIISILTALAIGLGGGYWIASSPTGDKQISQSSQQSQPIFYRNPMNPTVTSAVPAKDEMGMDYIPVYADADTHSSNTKEAKILFYRNPMNPTITSAVPAQDDMGMDYIPVYEESADRKRDASGTVQIDPVTVQNIGVRTVLAKQQELSRTVRAVGRVAFDEQRLAKLHPKTKGWIDKLMADKTGSIVKKDDILLSIYSPQLVSSQEEYLLALKNKQVLSDSSFEDIRQGAIDLVKTARERLELLDVPNHQIIELEQTKTIKKMIHIHSPVNGVVMNVGAREGQYVTPMTQLYMLADLSKVWVFVDIYEYELPWISVGDKVEMRLSGIPGQVFRGRLGYVYPYAEAKTRTVKVRLEFNNPKRLLKPDMFADVIIHASHQVNAITVPSQAIVRSGTREQVFIVRGPGKFEPREVKLGVTTDGMTQIIEGVQLGEEVVASALFLIDSESKLREATAKMIEASKPSVEPSQQHPIDSMPMDGSTQNPATLQNNMDIEDRNHD